MDSSDDDGDSEWRKLMFSAVSRKRKRGAEISEQKRCQDIQECLDEEVDINAVDKNGDTVLHKAVMGGYLEVVQFLRGKMASIEITNKADLTAFDLAEKLGKTEILKYLKESSKSAIDQSRPQSLSAPVDIPSNQPDISIPVTLNPKRTHDADNDNDRSAKKLRTSEKRMSVDEYEQGGITKSLHGTIYQLKHYMLILQRASKFGYSFRLAKEMEAADKLDDLVFEYEDKDTASLIHRFVQLKHKAAEEEQITATSLSNVTGGNFSLLKYFISWLQINKRPEFNKSVSKDYIICTNIGVDKDGLKEEGITVEPVTEADEFLEVANGLEGKEPQCYKLKVDKHHFLFDVLKTTSDIYRLAKELAEHVHKAKKLTLTTEILKKYHVSLTNEVIDIGRKRFKKNFVDPAKYGNLTMRAKKFHDIFLLQVKNMPKNKNKADNDIWKKLEDIKIEISETFGKGEARELPDDYISDYEVSRFFEEFTIAVHQPNEIELTKIMSEEMAEKFNVHNADSLVNDFQTAVLDWFKESGTRGRYLTEINVGKIYDKIWQNFCTQVTIGLSLPYKEKLKDNDVKFKLENANLKKFLSANSASGQPLKLTSCQETLLIVSSLYQILGTMTTYQKADSYILIKLDTLKLQDVSKNVLFAFGSSRSHILLIIDCAGNSDEIHTLDLWSPLIEITENDRNKKLILIDQSPNDSPTSDKEYVDIGFKNLERKSRAKLLGRKVRFQGQAEMSWGTLLGIRDLNNIGKEDEEDLALIFDVDTLVKLIQSKPIEIGEEVKRLDHHYVNRTIIRNGVLKKRFLTEPGLTDFDLIATDESTSWRIKTSLTLFGETGLAGPCNEECVSLKHGREADDFKNLCDKNPTRNIHWLGCQSGALICKQSTGGISNLVAYDYNSTTSINQLLDDYTPIAVWLTEDELLEQDEYGRVIVISDTAGMGKSTLLTELTQKMKKREPSLLVIRIDLSSPEITPTLLVESENHSFDAKDVGKAVDFLVDKLVKPGLGSKVFKRLIMKVKGGAALLFDGFDEISPTYEETVSTLLLALAKLGIKHLVVTTRLHTSKALEQKLETSSYRLQPFSDDDQNKFLIEFWKRELGSTVIDENIENQLQDHAQKVIHSLSNSINDQLTEFTGIPLQTRMVAEVYSPVTGGKHRKTGNCDFPPIPSPINLITLYRKFVEKKYDVYYTDKNHGDKSNLRQMENQIRLRAMYDAAHQKLALDALFNEHDVISLLRSQTKVQNYFSLWQQGLDNGETTGIVTRVIDGKAEFIHRTYAEYFAAEFLFNTLNAKYPEQDSKIEEDCKKFFLAELFIAYRYKIIRAFLNCIFLHETDVPREKERWRWNFRKNSYLFHDTALHRAAAESHIGIAEFLLNSPNSRSKNPVSQNIINGRDQTKVRATTGVKNSDDFDTTQDLKNKKSKSSNLELNDIETRDSVGRTPLHRAAWNTNLEMVMFLINKGANIEAQNEKGRTPLHGAVQFKKCETAKYLIDKDANIDTQDKEGRTPLHEAASNHNWKIAKYLIDKGANIDTQDKEGRVPLHEAASDDDWERAKYLIDKGAKIDTQDKEGRTPLHDAVRLKKWETAKYLIDEGANIDTQDKEGRVPLHKAASDDDWERVKYLVDKGAKIDTQDNEGRTPLQDAVWFKKWETAKYLIDKGANIDTQDKEGRTPLHRAALACKLETAKYLIDKGANIDTQDEEGRTPLHEASSKNRWETAKYLIDKGANIATQDKKGRTPLHEAALNDDWEVAKYFIDKGAKIDTQNKEGRTPLHDALRFKKWETAKYLIDKGAQIDTQDKEGRTLLHEAASNSKWEKVKYLIDKGANIDTQDKEGRVPLHEAALNDDWETAKYIIDKGANIDIQDKEGRTPLHDAVRSTKWETAKYLIDEGANLNCRESKGLTPLHFAVIDLRELIEPPGAFRLPIEFRNDPTAIIKLLLKGGADATIRDVKGRTPHDLATSTFKSSNKVHILFNIDDRNESDLLELEGS